MLANRCNKLRQTLLLLIEIFSRSHLRCSEMKPDCKLGPKKSQKVPTTFLTNNYYGQKKLESLHATCFGACTSMWCIVMKKQLQTSSSPNVEQASRDNSSSDHAGQLSSFSETEQLFLAISSGWRYSSLGLFPL